MKRTTISILGLVLALAFPAASQAETVIEKVARTGVLTVGTQFDLVPYSYIDADGNLVGLSIDILNRIEAQLEAELSRDIVVQRREATSLAERIPLITSGEIDLACETQFTWERDRHVDFSLSYGLSGIRLLTLTGSELGTPDSLANQKIAVLADSIAEDVMGLVQPGATLVPVSSPKDAFDALQTNQVAAIAGDTVVLSGIAAQRGEDNYRLAPDLPYERYGIACMVPENNSTFLNMVNYAIGELLQGYVSGDTQAVSEINQWLGPEGIVPLPADLLDVFFEMVLIQRAQVPPVSGAAPE